MMATVIFFEKPGCGNNTRQKVWLAASGHTVLARNLLTEKWTAARLRPFFGDLPVAHWFNPAAPRVKSGEVRPAAYDAQTAIEMMIAEPLLIRRPLMDVEGELRVGFDPEAVNIWIGLNNAKPDGDIEACPKGHLSQPCPVPETPSPQSSPACGRGSNREQPSSTLENSHA
jgi:nitrogenase-associated protein